MSEISHREVKSFLIETMRDRNLPVEPRIEAADVILEHGLTYEVLDGEGILDGRGMKVLMRCAAAVLALAVAGGVVLLSFLAYRGMS